MNELVFKGESNQALTNSLLVAEKFGKEHKIVMRSIRELIVSVQNCTEVKMFLECTYSDIQGKEQPMYIMNRDGFSLLVMGFTGKKAMQFKLDYITAFNSMEKQLKEQQKPLSQIEILVQSAQALLEHSQRISNVEKRLDSMEQERETNSQLLLVAHVSSEKVPEMSLRDNIRQLVNRYASAINIPQRDVWHKIYDQLYYLYHISIKAYKKDKRESNLDVAERNGFIDKVYIVISNLIRERDVA